MGGRSDATPIANEDRLDWIRNNFQQVKKDVEQKLYMTKMASADAANQYLSQARNYFFHHLHKFDRNSLLIFGVVELLG